LGAKHLSRFDNLSHLHFVARMIEVPTHAFRANFQIIQQRGPFTVEGEKALFVEKEVGLLVTRNSGAEASYPKIQAARELSLPVLMIQQPKRQTVGHQVKAAQLVSHLSLLLR